MTTSICNYWRFGLLNIVVCLLRDCHFRSAPYLSGWRKNPFIRRVRPEVILLSGVNCLLEVGLFYLFYCIHSPFISKMPQNLYYSMSLESWMMSMRNCRTTKVSVWYFLNILKNGIVLIFGKSLNRTFPRSYHWCEPIFELLYFISTTTVELLYNRLQ